ncbi:hypothetical protein B4113_3960 [Geobacillus sp. B4113_201601]|nr:hypothetical protein B4113_3960 [Geobacillus sp. B4113_201601]
MKKTVKIEVKTLVLEKIENSVYKGTALWFTMESSCRC